LKARFGEPFYFKKANKRLIFLQATIMGFFVARLLLRILIRKLNFGVKEIGFDDLYDQNPRKIT